MKHRNPLRKLFGKPDHSRFEALRFETLEPRLVLANTPLITEFMASNSDTLVDGDGNSSDWIEIHNPTAAAIDLAGWHLTDDAANLDQWTFPSLPQSMLDPGEYLVVYASGQATETYVDPGGNLHTNFRLNIGGEYLGLTDSTNAIIHEYAPTFEAQTADVSFGVEMATNGQTLIDENSTLSYLVPPDGLLGDTWIETSFDDTDWDTGTAGIGYETRPGDAVNYVSLLDTTIDPGTTTAYTRFEFTVTNPSEFRSHAVDILTCAYNRVAH